MKRARTISASTGPTVERAKQGEALKLVAQEHTDLPKGAVVRLLPWILQVQNAPTQPVRVGRVQISPTPRTPSPYGSRMGDHTIAWTVHLDVIKAELYGKTLEEAVDWLENTHNAAALWMEDSASPQMQMLKWLSDYEQRIPLLEDSCHRTRDFIRAARNGLDAGMHRETAAGLSSAIAHHLAYVNYLPYSTVRNLTSRGSIGSAEAHARGVVMYSERYIVKEQLEHQQAQALHPAAGGMPSLFRQGAEYFARPPEPEAVKAALWRLFSFDAALRETGLAYAIDPDSIGKNRSDNQVLGEMAANLTGNLHRRASFSLDLQRMQATADEIAERLRKVTDQQHLFKAALTLRNCARDLPNVWGDEQKELARSLKTYRTQIGRHLGLAKVEATGEQHLAASAPRRVVQIMSSLLHEHQRLCATAYPFGVAFSGFLQPSPGQAAVTQLKQQIAALYPKLNLGTRQAGEILAAVEAALDAMALPATDQIKPWVVDDTHDPLVVVYEPGKPLVINGRPGAPAGVSGMGCHTTAWVIQSTAVQKLLLRTRTDDEALLTLDQAVGRDLASPVMALDRLLPLAQLAGGQLHALFQAAYDTLSVETPSEAATAYLTFRNLLPFATVDPGDRGGHGESLTATEADTFDAKALKEQIGLSVAERGRVWAALCRQLTAVATELEETLLEEDEDSWNTDTTIMEAVNQSIARLRNQALLLRAGTEGDVGKEIMDARRQEHSALYRQAHS
ncbi:hypothetical protein GCM10022224_065210 [Nonomuraea antimicrobica]|uniref:Uncharacterized protein n=1 Tax=Nonomuraea antimicrobica TaxID=561173 RepID=A0ABP7CKT4_9ACTN